MEGVPYHENQSSCFIQNVSYICAPRYLTNVDTWMGGERQIQGHPSSNCEVVASGLIGRANFTNVSHGAIRSLSASSWGSLTNKLLLWVQYPMASVINSLGKLTSKRLLVKKLRSIHSSLLTWRVRVNSNGFKCDTNRCVSYFTVLLGLRSKVDMMKLIERSTSILVVRRGLLEDAEEKQLKETKWIIFYIKLFY